MEKGEKSEKGEKVHESKEIKIKRGKSFFEVGSFILLIVLIIIVLIVIQVPYTTTNAIKENVSTETCVEKDLSFAANFRTGSLDYTKASPIYSSEGQALYRYSDLKGYLYTSIRNIGDNGGIYCLDADAYLISDFDFTNGKESFDEFQRLLAEDSDMIKEIEDWNSSRYVYPVCTENPATKAKRELISLWGPVILSEQTQQDYDLDNVYLLFTIIPPTIEQCDNEYVEQEKEEEVTKYCNAWKHLVGRC
ncbi:MAG: hypothetical protein ACP5NZ_01165 [Nanobdellota archaeon]